MGGCVKLQAEFFQQAFYWSELRMEPMTAIVGVSAGLSDATACAD